MSESYDDYFIGKHPPSGETVGIVVPVRNMAEYLPGLLASIRAMYPKPNTVTFIDGASEDQTVACLMKTDLGVNYIVLKQEESNGTGAAMNQGIWSTETDWIVICGGDDRFEPHYIEELNKVQDQCDLFIPAYRTFGDENSLLIPHHTEDPRVYLNMLRTNNQLPIFTAFRRSLWKKVGGFDQDPDNHADDWTYWVQCMQQNPRIRYSDRVCFRFMQRKDSKWHSQGADRFEEMKQKVYRKAGWV